MERLTEKRQGQNVIPLRQDGKTKWAICSAGSGECSANYLYGDHADRLAAYEDAEEQGLLVRLHCRAGDTVYVKDGDQVRRGTVKNISITTEVVIRGTYNHFGLVYFAGKFGTSVFRTRKEAEAALKGERKDV